jgi:hypothetical protein
VRDYEISSINSIGRFVNFPRWSWPRCRKAVKIRFTSLGPNSRFRRQVVRMLVSLSLPLKLCHVTAITTTKDIVWRKACIRRKYASAGFIWGGNAMAWEEAEARHDSFRALGWIVPGKHKDAEIKPVNILDIAI